MRLGATGEVSLVRASERDQPVLANLLELYTHDLSSVFPEVALGPDGRYGYAKLPRYFSEPERCFAYLVRCAGELAGFALATRGSPAFDDPDVFDVAEFFVLRRYRRAGVGRRAAARLWRAHPGHWSVRVFEGNADALDFWRGASAAVADGGVRELERVVAARRWHVLSFEVRPPV
jgi:predicted acetyltransferase